MDRENIDREVKVIPISHDWGTYLGSQLAIRYEDRFEKFVFMSVAFTPAGRKLDIGKVNEMSQKMLGYPTYGYWLFLTEDGAGKIIGDNWEKFFNIVFAKDNTRWADTFAPFGALKEYLLTSDRNCEVASYISPEEKAAHHAAFGGDYSAATNWYHRGINNIGVDEEIAEVKKGKFKQKIGKETLMITGLKDPVCLAQIARSSMKGNVETGKLKMVDVEASHWIMLERKEQTNEILGDFFERGVHGKSML
ncbi:hypothetical protein B7494_g5794 [Chlorociboria aeruginascens]|nr:hypothetical protein B7494_g5794 [Chlorociboria aeruginascens]